jgi:geranylgeranyl diphosphate synthase type II
LVKIYLSDNHIQGGLDGMGISYNTINGEKKESKFLNFIAQHRDMIRSEIFNNLKDPTKLSHQELHLKEHFEMLYEYPLRGGKYIRPGLLLCATKAFGGKISDAIKSAAAMEVSEDWILIHDDFQDKSLQRRGKPALPQIYGNELAVNAGDALHILMWRILLDNSRLHSPELTFKLFYEMNSFLNVTCEGQFLELKYVKDGKQITSEQYFEIIDRKTSWYTIIGPMRLGAIHAAAKNEAFDSLIKFGLPLGRAFQIHDDWLNIYSTNTGKELGGDILEGKRTLLLIHLLNNCTVSEEARVVEIYKLPREDKSNDMLNEIIELMNKYDCKSWTREQVENYASNAQNELTKIPGITEEGSELLEDAVELIINREL